MPRNHFLLALTLSCCLAMPVQSADVRPAAPDLGTFAGEADMQHDLLQMLATFATYLKNDYQDLGETNAAGEPCGTFRSHNTLKANEDGVRTNADLGMVAAFLCLLLAVGANYSGELIFFVIHDMGSAKKHYFCSRT